MAADIPTRWYLQRAAGPYTHMTVVLIVELVEDAPARGYRVFVESRAHARHELPHLRRLVQSIGPREPAVLYDPHIVEAFKDLIGANGSVSAGGLSLLIDDVDEPA